MTKSALIFTVIFLCCWSVLLAQKDSSRFEFHLQAGLAGSQVAGDGLSGFNKLNLFAGAGISTMMSEKWAVGFELNYAQKGSRRNIDPEENNGQDKYKMSLNYIQIPVLFRYDHNEKISVKMGPGLGILVNSKEEDFLGEITTNPEFENLELSGIVALSFRPAGNLRTELRFDQSLLPIRQKDSGVNFQLDGRQFNTVLTLLVSYSLN